MSEPSAEELAAVLAALGSSSASPRSGSGPEVGSGSGGPRPGAGGDPQGAAREALRAWRVRRLAALGAGRTPTPRR
jgi:hypothetical protein